MDGEEDLVGGPFAVIESDPGVFTTFIQKLGVSGLEVTEIYDIEPWAVDHLRPYGLIFCFLCSDTSDASGADSQTFDDLQDRDAQRVWFANQLSDDACASQAILNVLLNCRNISLGDQLQEFYNDTEQMSPVMKGLAVSSSNFIREAQNSLARPADIRGAFHAIASSTVEAAKSKAKATSSRVSATKKRKTTISAVKSKQDMPTEDADNTKQEAYHFIGYVPAYGKVWELDGLRNGGPLEVGELPDDGHCWMDIVRPALRMRMQRYLQGGLELGNDNIRFNLLAVVDDGYLKASDELELLKRERQTLERRLNEVHPNGWHDKVDKNILENAQGAFSTSLRSPDPGRMFSEDSGARKMEKQIAIMDMSERGLPRAWEACVNAALPAKIAVEDEIEKSKNAHADHIKRTFDYEPFIREFITSLHNEGLLDTALNKRVDDERNAQESVSIKKPKAKRKK